MTLSFQLQFASGIMGNKNTVNFLSHLSISNNDKKKLFKELKSLFIGNKKFNKHKALKRIEFILKLYIHFG